ncbi:MAG TPA: GlsB/YeaQ/YmgE family stress response membrane protein [Streptomyces sp.]|nr:GlsB/YeaQ/YmgE family stress response membrane protein [Streptomyces sp.]
MSSTSIISWILLGLIAGVVAKVLLPGRDPGGLVGTTVIGVAGAFIGGWLSAEFLDRPITTDFYDPALWVAAVAGSVILLIGYRLLFGHSRARH